MLLGRGDSNLPTDSSILRHNGKMIFLAHSFALHSLFVGTWSLRPKQVFHRSCHNQQQFSWHTPHIGLPMTNRTC